VLEKMLRIGDHPVATVHGNRDLLSYFILRRALMYFECGQLESTYFVKPHIVRLFKG
jgi:hypothetical protein